MAGGLGTVGRIVEATGLSTPTVKKILAGRGDLFRPETKRRVLDTAQRLGYRPNAAAWAISTGRYGAIGMIVSTCLRDAIVHPDTLWALQEELRKRDMHLVLSSLPEAELTSEEAVPRIIREWSVDAMLINYTAHFPAKGLELLRRYRVPSIWLNAKLPVNCVHPDDYHASRSLTQQLLDLGHRRILYLCDISPIEHYSYADRWQGYVDAMVEAGCRVHGLRNGVEYQGLAGLAPALSRVLASADRPTAVVSSEGHAETTMIVAQRMGLSVPRNLSLMVLGHEETRMAEQVVSGKLVPFADMGTQAIALLERRIQHPGQDQPAVALPFVDSPGQTIAPAPSEPLSP